MNILNKSIITFILVMLYALPVSNASEKDLYNFLWLDQDKSVYVLQNKLFKKKNTYYFDLGYLRSLTSKYQSTSGLSLRVGHHFSEEFAVELLYNKYSNTNNDAYESLALINQSVPFVRRLNSSMALFAIWSPFYGKINTFNKIFYFDWSFGLGLGQVEAESNSSSVGDPDIAANFTSESHKALFFKTKIKFHINKNINIGVEYLNTTYKAQGPILSNQPVSDKLRSNSDIVFSIGFSF